MSATQVQPRLRIDLLGPPEIRSGERLVVLKGRKDMALLAVVALATGRKMSRGRLAGLLWPESPEARARDSLKHALLRIRRTLAPVADGALLVDRSCVALAPWVDVDACAVLTADTDAAAERALMSWRGALLDGLRLDGPGLSDWLRIERSRIENALVRLAASAMKHAERRGHEEAATAAAHQLLAVEPFSEEAVRLLMRRHAARGERGRALDLFQSLRDRLAAELEARPEDATVQLYHMLQSKGAEAVRTNPKPAAARSSRSPAVMPFAKTDDSGSDRVAAGSAPRDGSPPRMHASPNEIEVGRQIGDGRYGGAPSDAPEPRESVRLRGRCAEPPVHHDNRGGTSDLAAYQCYMRARSYHVRGHDGRSLDLARVLYLRAIDHDPAFVRALAQLAICESHLSMSGAVDESVPPSRPLARSMAALDLDPLLADAHAGLGLSFYAAGRYAEADAALTTAISLNPMLFEACFFEGRNRRLQGRREEAAALFERAAALRLNDYRSVGLLAEELQALKRGEDAVRALGRCLERLEAEIEAHPENADALAFGSAVLADLGRRDEAVEWASSSLVLGRGQRLVHYNVARTWVMIGRRTEALGELESAFSAPPVVRRRLALWMLRDEDLAPLSGERRFRALLEASRQVSRSP